MIAARAVVPVPRQRRCARSGVVAVRRAVALVVAGAVQRGEALLRGGRGRGRLLVVDRARHKANVVDGDSALSVT